MNMKIGKTTTIASMSDIHFECSSVPTSHLVDNIIQMLPNDHKTKKLDYLILAGDVFEKDISLYIDELEYIHVFVRYILDLCYNLNIKLRILEGTNSHDWKQSRLFVNTNLARGEKACDLLYLDEVSVVKEDDGNVFLYVPDNVGTCSDDAWDLVVEKMANAGVDQVDYAVTHGMYEHQLPAHLGKHHHDSERYLAIVKKYIFNGHIHTSSVYKERLLTNGSTGRLAHGEEEDKGFWWVVSHKDSFEGDEITFKINHNAAVFDTIDIRGFSDSKDIAPYLMKKLATYKKGDNVRFHSPDSQTHLGIIKSVICEFPDLIYKVKHDKDKKRDVEETSRAIKLETINLGKDNLANEVGILMGENGETESEISDILETLAMVEAAA